MEVWLPPTNRMTAYPAYRHGGSVKEIDISPAAARLTGSLRDIGYDFMTAVADIVDNSIEAGARSIDISLEFNGDDSWVRIADDGLGMRPKVLDEALRFGTRRSYGEGELGRFGLGLKTASLSQCRRLIVITRAAKERKRIHARIMDLDYIARTDSWTVLKVAPSRLDADLIGRLESTPGTAVVWAHLDRVFDGLNSRGGYARRRLERLAVATREHIGMVFHRFLDGEVPDRDKVKITVNGELVEPWDPFARSEPLTQELPSREFILHHSGKRSSVEFRPFVLPHREAFSTQQAFERFGGPKRWNRHQGLYIYRAHRLIQAGGWAGTRAIDEHTKFARAALEFPPTLDELFKVNVAKMRVTLPPDLKTPLERSVGELVTAAQTRYRRGEIARKSGTDQRSRGELPDLSDVGVAIRAAAIEVGEVAALTRIEDRLKLRSAEIATAVGWLA